MILSSHSNCLQSVENKYEITNDEDNDNDDDDEHHHHHNHHHHLANMELLTRSGLTRLEISLTVSHDFFCLHVCRFFVFSVIY